MPNMSLKKVTMPEQEPDVRNKSCFRIYKRNGNGRSNSLFKL